MAYLLKDLTWFKERLFLYQSYVLHYPGSFGEDRGSPVIPHKYTCQCGGSKGQKERKGRDYQLLLQRLKSITGST